MTSPQRRVAAIDCGTNSIRLLIADVTRTDRGVTLVDVHRELRVVRLGEGVDRTGRLQPGALDRTWAALADYTAILRASSASAVRMVSTSAARDASNSADFVEMVRRTLGQPPEIISGREEAELSFLGAVGDLRLRDGTTLDPVLVVDIGGGSTELVVGSGSGSGAAIDGAVSLDLGSVRITERLLHGDPARPAEVAAARRLVADLLRPAIRALPLDRVGTLVAVSGTATTIAACALRLASYDPTRIHLAELSVGQVHRAGDFLLSATTAHRGMLPYMHPGRVDVIGGGAIILNTVVDLVTARIGLTGITVSEHDILDGLALSLA